VAPLTIHPKAAAGTVGATLGSIGAALLTSCGGTDHLLQVLAPIVMTAAAAWLAPSPKPPAPPLG
jgi:hypothetical protein